MSADHRGDDVRHAIEHHMPTYRVHSVVLLAEGADNAAFEVNGELIVRMNKEPDDRSRSRLVRREVEVLEAVRPISPLPIPQVQFAWPEQGCLAYLKLPGTPLLDLYRTLPPVALVRMAGTLGTFLRSLQATPLALMAYVVEVDHRPLIEWRDEARSCFQTIQRLLPGTAHRRISEFFEMSAPPDTTRLAFSHNDLGIEHVLVTEGRAAITGVIDWTDAAIVDPAHDLGRLLRDLGPMALDAALDGYAPRPVDEAAFRERAMFYARCSVFEDLAHGVETNDARYVDKSLRAMEWLFPSP